MKWPLPPKLKADSWLTPTHFFLREMKQVAKPALQIMCRTRWHDGVWLISSSYSQPGFKLLMKKWKNEVLLLLCCCCCFQSVTGRLQQQQGSHLALAFLRVFYRQLAEMIHRKEAGWLLLETWTMDWKGFKRELCKTDVLLAITVCLMRVFLVW